MSDIEFDQVICHLKGFDYFCECSFTKGAEGKRGKKPCPDGLLVDKSDMTAYYIEKKRPSECRSNSWLSSNKADRFPDVRHLCAKLNRDKRIDKETAQALVVLEEHDEHMRVIGSRWNDPNGLAVNKRALVFIIPKDVAKLIYRLCKVLKTLNRYIRKRTIKKVTFIFVTNETGANNASGYIQNLQKC